MNRLYNLIQGEEDLSFSSHYSLNSNDRSVSIEQIEEPKQNEQHTPVNVLEINTDVFQNYELCKEVLTDNINDIDQCQLKKDLRRKRKLEKQSLNQPINEDVKENEEKHRVEVIEEEPVLSEKTNKSIILNKTLTPEQSIKNLGEEKQLSPNNQSIIDNNPKELVKMFNNSILDNSQEMDQNDKEKSKIEEIDKVVDQQEDEDSPPLETMDNQPDISSISKRGEADSLIKQPSSQIQDDTPQTIKLQQQSEQTSQKNNSARSTSSSKNINIKVNNFNLEQHSEDNQAQPIQSKKDFKIKKKKRQKLKSFISNSQKLLKSMAHVERDRSGDKRGEASQLEQINERQIIKKKKKPQNNIPKPPSSPTRNIAPFQKPQLNRIKIRTIMNERSQDREKQSVNDSIFRNSFNSLNRQFIDQSHERLYASVESQNRNNYQSIKQSPMDNNKTFNRTLTFNDNQFSKTATNFNQNPLNEAEHGIPNLRQRPMSKYSNHNQARFKEYKSNARSHSRGERADDSMINLGSSEKKGKHREQQETQLPKNLWPPKPNKSVKKNNFMNSKKPQTLNHNNKESPYSSQFQLKILHDYFGIDCKPLGYNKDGIPFLKLKRVSQPLNQNLLMSRMPFSNDDLQMNSMNDGGLGTNPPLSHSQTQFYKPSFKDFMVQFNYF